jgi:hypothetical protein
MIAPSEYLLRGRVVKFENPEMITEYIGTMSAEMAKLAHRTGRHDLAFILEVAAAEAGDKPLQVAQGRERRSAAAR